MKRNIETISIDEIIEVFEKSENGKEVLEYFGYKDNGSGRRFLKKLEDKANILGENYFNRVTKRKYLLNPTKCLCCGKEFSFEKRNNKFCNSSCAAKYNNYKRGALSSETKSKISKSLKKEEYSNEVINEIKKNFEKICLMCGSPSGKKDFCSLQCRNAYVRNLKIKEWIEGKSNPQRGVGQLPEYIKEYLNTIHRYKCEKCGWGEKNPITGKVPLQIHHIDGDCTNNRFENLQILCPNCHSLTETYGSLNKVSKRFHRAKVTVNELKNNEE